MKSKKIGSQPDAYVLIFEVGDEIASVLDSFAREHDLSASSFKAIGALSSVRLGWYNPDTRQYETAVALDEQLELVSLTGDIGKLDGVPTVHAHMVVGRHDGSTAAGHLLHAIVHPTTELFLTEYPTPLVKEHVDEFNLNLFKP